MTTTEINPFPMESTTLPRVRMFGIDIDLVNMDDAIQQVVTWLNEPHDVCRFVVTPNVDHAVMVQEHEGLRRVYDDAHLVLADGLPIILASRLLKKGLPQRVAGSELVPLLMERMPRERKLRVYLLGAGPGVAERAAAKIAEQWPGVQVVGTYSPPLGFEKDSEEEARILQKLREAEPELLVVGLGAPKQELWVHKHFHDIPAKVALCVGATIDFIAGEKQQAPVWMRRTGLEWFHRMMSEPRRLAKRYAKDAWIFPRLVWREWRGWAR
ncbi:MAG: WecB/TagA/CpsF family glycosyltransferase [Planctomycetales bacterium]|nr:WecB/TagA/CpsF family glycosyltransferase [Planctomycetales bacterium]